MKKFKSAIKYMDERPIYLEKYSNIPFFDHEKIDKLRGSLPEITHRIGVCRSDIDNAYCLARSYGSIESTIVIMTKSIKDRAKFDKEVKVLSKIFNAKVIEEIG